MRDLSNGEKRSRTLEDAIVARFRESFGEAFAQDRKRWIRPERPALSNEASARDQSVPVGPGPDTTGATTPS